MFIIFESEICVFKKMTGFAGVFNTGSLFKSNRFVILEGGMAKWLYCL